MTHQSKNKKSVPTSWNQCDKCSANLLNKDFEKHSSDCPPNLQNVSYNFIKDEVLYGTADLKAMEDVKNLSSAEIDNLVFLSQSVIQLCCFSIGDWAVVRGLGGKFAPVVRTVWPTTEKSLTSVLFTKNALILNHFETNEVVTVSKISSELLIANCVAIVLLNRPISLEISPELCNRIGKNNVGRILCVGNKVSLMFYGKLLKFEVKLIEAGDGSGDLENGFAGLNIDDKYEFFNVTEKTRWKIYSDHNRYQKESKNQNSKSRSCVAGLENELTEIRQLLKSSLEDRNNSKVAPSRSVLLFGNSGTGKTTLADQIAEESKANVVWIRAPDLYGKYSAAPEETVKQLFQEAVEQSPSVLVLDEVDILCPLRTSRLSDSEKKISSTILLMLDDISENVEARVFIIATTSKIDNVDSAFRRSGRLDREIEIPTPNPHGRRSILNELLRDVGKCLTDDDLKNIAGNTHGFVGSDLVSLCSRASLNAAKRNDDFVKMDDFKMALKLVRPSAMREVQVEIPDVKWSDIGGQDNLKLILKQAVEWPIKHSASFVRLGVTPPKGVLMFGPPGCSKTMIAKALATESSVNFLSIKGPELFSKWVGESERAVREVFRKARQVAPSIIFFDEIDALGSERSSGSSNSVQERVLAQLLTELDGVTPLGDVTVLAATNRPDKIDKALLRPGRLDRIVYVPLPDGATRRDIFRIKFIKMPVLDVNLDDLVAKTENYSGAEINAVCHEAAMFALEEDLDIRNIESRHFEKALSVITPRTPKSLIELYEDYLKIKI